MKKLTLTLLALGLAVSTVVASDDTNSFYNANEFSLKASLPVSTDGAAFEGLEVGAGYFFTKHLGLEASVPINYEGVTVREANAGAVIRLPIGRLAPYVRGGVNYEWNADQLAGYVGAGLEWKVTSHLSAFGGADYQFTSGDAFAQSFEEDDVTFNAGLRWTF
jgi:hypothetical protein